MSSYANDMPSSPGYAQLYERYSSGPYNNTNGYEDQKQQLSSVKEENLRLKVNLTRVQNEYEELRDESNYQRAKVSELKEIVAASSNTPASSFPPSNYNNNASNEYADSTIHNQLIEKSLANAELSLAVDRLNIDLRNSEAKLADLQLQKRANNKLLLEMGDVIRTLNSVDIDYVATSSPGKRNLTAQQLSVKNIKLKVEAMMRDRKYIVKRCRELDDLTRAQEQKILALEAQFHVVNTANLSAGIAMGDVVIHTKAMAPYSSPSIAAAASNLTDDATYGQQQQAEDSVTSNAASEIVRQSKELARYKKREEEQEKEIEELKMSEQTFKNTIVRLEAKGESDGKKLEDLEENLTEKKEELEETVSKRDEFKENLRDIILHYKELEIEHEAAKGQIAELESVVQRLETELGESKEREEKQQAAEKNRQQIAAEKESKEKPEVDCKMDDMVVAYAQAMKKIKNLEATLMKKEMGNSQYRESIGRFKKLERERNEFQRKLNKAMEETRAAKKEAQKEKGESRQVRRRLKALLQKRDDDASESGHSASSRSVSSHSKKASGVKKDTGKSKAYTPLTIEELMKKDFS